jgi:hypothetical protein
MQACSSIMHKLENICLNHMMRLAGLLSTATTQLWIDSYLGAAAGLRLVKL